MVLLPARFGLLIYRSLVLRVLEGVQVPIGSESGHLTSRIERIVGGVLTIGKWNLCACEQFLLICIFCCRVHIIIHVLIDVGARRDAALTRR